MGAQSVEAGLLCLSQGQASLHNRVALQRCRWGPGLGQPIRVGTVLSGIPLLQQGV